VLETPQASATDAKLPLGRWPEELGGSLTRMVHQYRPYGIGWVTNGKRKVEGLDGVAPLDQS
jgi:hypothetical protein